VSCSNLALLRLLFLFAPLLLSALSVAQTSALRVTEPPPSKDGSIVSAAPAIYLKGTLAWNGGDMRVLWKSNRGFSDLATVRLADDRRTVLWNSASPVPLRPGVNHVRIKALGQSAAAIFVNIFYTPQTTAPPLALRTTVLHGKEITYEVRDGLAIYQGDMILGKAADVATSAFASRLAVNNSQVARPQSVTIGPNLLSSTGLWPVVNGVVRVPYTNPTLVNATNVNVAIAESNTQLAGIVQWVPATASDFNLVEFNFDPSNSSGSCESSVGMIGGTQTIGGSYACVTSTILHEMGHALGLYHEHQFAVLGK